MSILENTKLEKMSNLTKKEAYDAMTEGHRVRHRFYGDEEYIFIDLDTGKIKDEQGYDLGSSHDEFWAKYQKWERGWSILDL